MEGKAPKKRVSSSLPDLSGRGQADKNWVLNLILIAHCLKEPYAGKPLRGICEGAEQSYLDGLAHCGLEDYKGTGWDVFAGRHRKRFARALAFLPSLNS